RRHRDLHALPPRPPGRGGVGVRGRRPAVPDVRPGPQPDARHDRPVPLARRDRGDPLTTSRSARLTKPQRQHRIQRLLEDQAVSTQEQLVELLAADGVVATQATVSRDLEDLGAIKVRVPGGETVYAVPAMPKDAVA